mmetsp:Transcript_121787/g.192884  ORF Transcript_121787/g.192884 Transcript_121787/m.192884 type:complete len:128 (+) Transcript_121787:3-386(+)
MQSRVLELVLHGLVCVSATAPDFQLELFPAELAKQRGAQCLDHSPAGYYIRKQDPSKWLIFLEGGGLCVTPFDCLARRDSAQGSSKYWQQALQHLILSKTILTFTCHIAVVTHGWVGVRRTIFWECR